MSRWLIGSSSSRKLQPADGQQRQRQPAALAEAELAHRHEHLVPGEQEVVQEAARLGLVQRRGRADQRQRRGGQVERLLLLRHVAQPHARGPGGPRPPTAAGRR